MNDVEIARLPTLEEALARILEHVRPVGETKSAKLEDAYGAIAAEDIAAPFAVPPLARSAMDGYALRARDTDCASREAPVRLRVAGAAYAGDDCVPHCAAGTAVRVTTGAALPEGCDAVVRQEDTDRGRETVAVYRGVAAGENVCAAGEDIRHGEVVLHAGERIGRTELGLLASLGAAHVPVRKSARVALLATGSELLPPSAPLAPGKIYDSILPMLRASIRAEGLCVCESELCGDDTAALARALHRASEHAELIVTTGGVSVGERDLVPDALASLGAEILFRRVNVKPGTPTTASVLDGVPVLSLSGNPYAALANFDYYFYPIAAKLMGGAAPEPRTISCVAAQGYDKPNKLRRLLRAMERDGRVSFPDANHKASVISNLLACNCYVDLPADTVIAPGDTVRIRRMRTI